MNFKSYPSLWQQHKCKTLLNTFYWYVLLTAFIQMKVIYFFMKTKTQIGEFKPLKNVRPVLFYYISYVVFHYIFYMNFLRNCLGRIVFCQNKGT